MLRAAAKNFNDVTVIVDPDDYDKIAELLKKDQLDQAIRKQLAAKVFQHTANYDAMIANYFTDEEIFPEQYTVTYEKKQALRNGENTHQKADFYENPVDKSVDLAISTQLH